MIVRGGTVVTPEGIAAPTSRSRTAASPRSRRSCRATRGDRRARPPRSSRRHRRPRAFQRARPHRMGRRRHRQPRPRRRRRHGLLRHAAQLRRRAPSAAPSSTPSAPRSSSRRSPISRCGAASCPAIATVSPNWRSAASSASKHSWPIPACPSFRAATTSRSTKACARPRGSACPSPCTPRTTTSSQPPAAPVRRPRLSGLASRARRGRGHPARGAARPRSRREAAHRPHQLRRAASPPRSKRARRARISRSRPARITSTSPTRTWSASAPCSSAPRRSAPDGTTRRSTDIEIVGVRPFPRAALDEDGDELLPGLGRRRRRAAHARRRARRKPAPQQAAALLGAQSRRAASALDGRAGSPWATTPISRWSISTPNTPSRASRCSSATASARISARPSAASVRRTILRGRTIFEDGKITAASCGRMVEHAKARLHP